MKNSAIIRIWGSIFLAVLRNKGSTNGPKMKQFDNFSYTNFKLKGGQFNEKIVAIFIWGSILRAVLK